MIMDTNELRELYQNDHSIMANQIIGACNEIDRITDACNRWALDAVMWRERAEAERQRAEQAREGLRDVIHYIRDDFGSYAIATANDVLAATEPAEEGK